MIVTAWNNGKHHSDGNGDGLKISSHDRDLYFDTNWKTIFLELEGKPEPVEININKKNFWNKTCRELISKDIGKWLIQHHHDRWVSYYPPELDLQKVGDRRFHLSIHIRK